MDQRSIIVFLHVKRFSAKTKHVHIELGRALVSDVIACLTVTKYLRNDVILRNELEAEDEAEDQGFSIKGNAILETLEMISFASNGQITKMTFILHPSSFILHPSSFILLTTLFRPGGLTHFTLLSYHLMHTVSTLSMFLMLFFWY
jgi:hypothetical protein